MTGFSGGDARPDVGQHTVVPLDGLSRLPREYWATGLWHQPDASPRSARSASLLPGDRCLRGFLAGDERVLIGWPDVLAGVRGLERETSSSFGRGLGLLLSVRSGAALSMPGMLDTVLDLIDDAVLALASQNSEGSPPTRGPGSGRCTGGSCSTGTRRPGANDPFGQLRGAIEAVSPPEQSADRRLPCSPQARRRAARRSWSRRWCSATSA
jgi:hypothetical protein